MTDDQLQAVLDRLRVLEDLTEIRQLYVDYGRSLDGEDVEGYASLFAQTAKLRLGGVMRGDSRDEIAAAAASVIRSGPDGVRRSVHVLGSPHVELDGDTATGDAVWVAILRSESGPPTVKVGRHVDKLVREDGRWRFAERRGYLDIG